ncbi:MAG: EamA family transporter, partial [Erysipelotrichaceae bacterium]|nr:EamA family transporter [Erysipelotrichaceae bacterium]
LVSVLVFLGILIVVSDGLGKGNLKGDLIALLSGVFYAFTIMLNDFDEADPLSSVWIGHFLTMLVGLPSLLGEADHSASTLLLVMILGIFQAGAGYTLLTVGLKTCDPLSASLIASIEPVLNPILVAIFYKEYIGPRALIGAFIVIVSIAAYNFLSMQKDNV